LTSHEKQEWIKALKLEYRQYCDLGMFQEVFLPKGRKAISTRMLMNRKADGRYRPRLVVRGFEQKEGIDYKEIFAPVANYSVFRFGIAVAATYRYKVRTFDVTAAYANSDMEEEIFIEIPEGYLEFCRPFIKKEDIMAGPLGDDVVLTLRKTLQGVKQGARNFYQQMKNKLESIGFLTSKLEPCLFYQWASGHLILLILWVDDFMFLAPETKEANEILQQVLGLYKIRETFGKILGMNIENGAGGIMITSEDYIARKGEEFGVNQHSIPCLQPMDVNLHLEKESGCSSGPYLEIIGSLIHAVNTTRPDIAFPVGVLARFGNCYGKKHYETAIRVLRYLYTTRKKGLFYKYQQKREITIDLYCDADFAGDRNSGKSTSGVIITINNNCVLWSSKLQSCVTKNTMQAGLGLTPGWIKWF